MDSIVTTYSCILVHIDSKCVLCFTSFESLISFTIELIASNVVEGVGI
jgi:hypothetical protein